MTEIVDFSLFNMSYEEITAYIIVATMISTLLVVIILSIKDYTIANEEIARIILLGIGACCIMVIWPIVIMITLALLIGLMLATIGRYIGKKFFW